LVLVLVFLLLFDFDDKLDCTKPLDNILSNIMSLQTRAWR